ncbi:complement C1q tumor necrosis factor-related protein 3-like [Mercenaria mercenaria]|uniref:complement C1q tumor necrosis factor-related protein 3-like n=1 Tax=Mercenaria mercenaria TaxID=6596 RepID=UPI00234F4E13|nr:complement C1q tumor necrosis factor-related protein 3-like [Mercenaria mercenaria]
MVWIIVILVLSKQSKCDIDGLEPGQCLSKFDYDYKVMRQLLKFEREIQELKQRNSCKDNQPVAFMAELPANLVSPPIGTTVVFSTVHTNVGHGYKPGPGIFVAPVDGTYSISLVASSSPKATSANLHLYIMYNTSHVGYIFLDHNSDRWLLRSTTIVLELKAEDTIYVKIGHQTGTVTLAGCCFHTHFSGFLIH